MREFLIFWVKPVDLFSCVVCSLETLFSCFPIPHFYYHFFPFAAAFAQIAPPSRVEMVQLCGCLKPPAVDISSFFTANTQQLLTPHVTYSNRGVEIDSDLRSAVPSNQLKQVWRGYLPWTFWTRDTAFRRGKVLPRTISACRFVAGLLQLSKSACAEVHVCCERWCIQFRTDRP